MSYILECDPCKFPVGDVTLKFEVDADTYSGTLQQLLVEFGDFVIGTDREDESIFTPNNLEIKIKTPDSFNQWISYLKDLSIESTWSTVMLDGKYLFRGYVQKRSVEGDMFRKTISFRPLDQLLTLKDIDPKTNPLGYGETEEKKIVHILTDILYNYLDINGVTTLCTYEAKIDGTSTYIDFSDFGVVPYDHYFNDFGAYDTMLDVLKSILMSYGCVGYVGTDEKFYMIPRTYQNNILVDIENNSIKDIELSVIGKMLGLKVYVFTGMDPGEYQTYNYGDVSTDPERVETVRVDQCVGDLPVSGQAQNLLLWDGANWQNAAMNGVRRKQADGTYTSDKSLWRLTGDDTWAAIQKDRLNYRVTLPGSFNILTKKSLLLSTHNPKQFYRLSQFPNEYLRPRKFKYDLTKNEVEIDLLST